MHYASDHGGVPDIEAFVRYWGKISELIKPKHRNLLRRALLTFGDYTLPVGEYKTLCVDDPNEAARTPSLKQLFSNRGKIVKQLLDTLDLSNDIGNQLRAIVKNSTVPKNDWRYCFIKESTGLFSLMSASHLRLRDVNGELIIIRNKISRGYNYGVFLAALKDELGNDSTFEGGESKDADRYLCFKGFKVRFSNGKFIINIKNATGNVVFKTTTDDPIAEAKQYLLK